MIIGTTTIASTQSAQALTFFTDRTAWEAAVQALGQTVVNEDFESFADGEVGDSFTTTTGVTIDCAESTSDICASPLVTKEVDSFSTVDTLFDGFDGQFLVSSAFNGDVLGVPSLGFSSEVVTLPTGNQAFGVNAAKFSVPAFGSAADGVVNFIIGGQTVATFDFPDGGETAEEYFFGVIAGTGEVVEQVTFSGYNGGILYDNLAYATPSEGPESVPEPTSVIGLLGFGALGLGLKRKKQNDDKA